MSATVDEISWAKDGFVRWSEGETFSARVGPLFSCKRALDIRFRVRVTAEHCNAHGYAHGGFLSALADIWLAYNIARRLPDSARIVTTGLAVDYLAPAVQGEVLESRIDHVKVGRTLCHAYGAIARDREPVAGMRGTFAIVA